MVSIFKVIRDNDIHLLNYLIDSSVGDQHHNTYNNIPKQGIQFIQQQLKNSGSKYYDLNRRSVNGRTALHCAVTWNRVEMAKTLIDCPSVNVNLQDRENGWTALHRALYMGNIEISRVLLTRDDIDLSIKDWEGYDAFELYNSTIPDTFPKEQIQHSKVEHESSLTYDQEEHWQSYHIHQDDNGGVKVGKGGTDVYTWGHNTNYVLGHADSENRLKPERVHLQLNSQQSPYIMTRPTCVIESVSMSKYHMAILTSEPQQNLLVCGFGRGGRLGTGKDNDTQFTPIPVQWPERILSVALGRDHTIAITGSGNVVTFGQNNFGQLGYETDNHGKEESPMQLVPRKIQAQSLKKQPILGAAASRVHSVVYTSTDIFTFGLNQGQLGYHQPDNESCQIIPRKVSMSTNILQVVANDNATVILSSSHDIILLCNYNQQKLFLPIHRFPNNIQVHRSEANYPVKLIGSSTEYLGAVTLAGDVFMWTCRSSHARQSEQQQQQQNRKLNSNSSTSSNKQVQTTIVSTPKRIWTVRKPHLAAVDASIGQHGEIIVCTVSGHVFIGRPEANGYKFNRIPSIQRCIQVCANSSGAFAAIRSEYQLQPITNIPPSTLVDDMITSLPHVRASNWLRKELGNISETEKEDMTRAFNKFKKNPTSTTIEEEDMEAYVVEKDIVKQKYDQVRIAGIQDAWHQSYSLATNDTTLDIILMVDGRKIYCHSSILRCRSEIFKRLVKCKDHAIGGEIKIKLNKNESDSRIEIYIEQCQLASVLLLLDYVYTDQYQHPMALTFDLPILSRTQLLTPSIAKSIQKDLLTLAKIFHVPNLIISAQENYYRQSHTLQQDFNGLLEKGKGTDVILKTKDENTDTKCHQVILRQRCAFFGNILKAGSIWVQDRRKQAKQDDNDGCIQVNLDHISKEVMDILLRYIYIDEDGSSLLNEVAKDREESMMNFLLAVLCEADALLLKRLKVIIETALVRFIKLRSAATIFEYADLYLAESLKKTCLQFISVNLPAFLGSSILDSTPTRLVRDLQDYVRHCQIQETPTVPRGEEFNFSADESFLEVEDPEFSTSIFASTRGDGSITSFVETLVTLQSSKPAKNQEIDEVANKKSSKSPILGQQETASSPTIPPKSDCTGKLKKRVKVSLDNLENKLNALQTQPRRSSSGWVAATESAESIAKPSLREIIETENQPLESASKSVKSSVPKKISQKERRRLMHKQELEAVTESLSSSKSVWGKVPIAEVQPIPKIITESITPMKESSSSQGSSGHKGKKIYVPEELLDEYEGDFSSSRPTTSTALEDENSFNPNESLGSSFSITPIRRLHLNNNGSNRATVNGSQKSFQTIQEQQQLEDKWRKELKPKKNIMKIQKEEEAIESIAQYYVQSLDVASGEWHEVYRLATR